MKGRERVRWREKERKGERERRSGTDIREISIAR